MRLGPGRRFQVKATGGATRMADLAWFAEHLPAGGTAALADDLTSAPRLARSRAVEGRRAREVLQVRHSGRRA